MNIQSTKFDEPNLIILDELMNHFSSNNLMTFNKTINLIASILRDYNCPIYILFNKVDNNDIFLKMFKLEKAINQVKLGHVKKFKRDWKINDELVSIKFAIYNPLKSEELTETTKKSIGYRLSALSEYGSVINSDKFYKN